MVSYSNIILTVASHSPISHLLFSSILISAPTRSMPLSLHRRMSMWTLLSLLGISFHVRMHYAVCPMLTILSRWPCHTAGGSKSLNQEDQQETAKTPRCRHHPDRDSCKIRPYSGSTHRRNPSRSRSPPLPNRPPFSIRRSLAGTVVVLLLV